MLQALADEAIATIKNKYRFRARLEGDSHSGWMLVDFGDVILHLFSPDRRNYYRLEELWSEGKVIVHLQ